MKSIPTVRKKLKILKNYSKPTPTVLKKINEVHTDRMEKKKINEIHTNRMEKN